ncbi:MAG: PD40 domain-containing protein [Burkholderiales bacterium]|nr:PD40 domain-containing protein [Burkholderiales bacterium]MDE1927307.1 PD40 domain-containing protein [Burkholderiales bacterium]MDE2159770.1 PD40 domain-containing protein [Burkholderiales bacterium]MDE2504520.1 PD40 domain-containing protein [Burkholderiales bacterium]
MSLLARWRALVAPALWFLCATVHGAAALGPLRDPLWMRYPALSPDGQHIAFSFGGNLYVAPAAGGQARLLVANGHHSFDPRWSPDSRSIAYASDVHGNFDVYIVSDEGGPSRRLTTHSAPELPLSFTPDGREVLFSAQRIEARRSAMFPGLPYGQLYAVPTESGQRPRRILTTPVTAAQYNRAGTLMVYEDWKGYENLWRKHHVSPVAHDIWLYDARSGRHRKLTGWGGENRNPVWSPDERAILYLSERSGSFNVWRMPLDHPEAAQQITHYKRNPVRFLSSAADGTLAWGHDGRIYTLAPGASEPHRVALQIAADALPPAVENLQLTQGATEVAASPDGAEVAFVLRGVVFVASTEFGDTQRISHLQGQARSVSFSPDGRRLLFAGEADGSWNLYEATLPGKRSERPYFYSSPQVPVRVLLKNGQENFQPRYAPDGKSVAYLENRTTLKVLDLASGKTHVVLPGNLNYSYADGDQWFDWSPDGRHFLVQFDDPNRWSNEVGLIDAQGRGPLLNLTRSGYEDVHPVWARGGRMMTWFTDRSGLHGAGGESQQDVYAMFFTRAAWDRYRLDPADYALLKKQEDAARAARKQAQKTKPSDDKAGDHAGAPALPAPVPIERAGLHDRIARLTPDAGDLQASAITPDGETLYTLERTADAVELRSIALRKKESHLVARFPSPAAGGGHDGPVDLVLDAKGEQGFVLVDGGIRKFKVPKEPGGEIKVEPLPFNAPLRLDHAAERAAMFEHVWRQTREKLYAANLNGVDWDYYHRVYARFLPYIADNYDFAEMLSEMLGELNVSHTGSGYRERAPGDDATAALGAFYDGAYTGPGLRVTEIIEGGPLDRADVPLKAGMVIEKIAGVAIAAGADVDAPLNRMAGRRIEISARDPASGKRFEFAVKPISQGAQHELLYRRWVKHERALVDRLSGGRIGYVHVRAMDDASYRATFSEMMGRDSGKIAEIVDTRNNGGGNLHDELAVLLSGRRYLEFVARGQALGGEPRMRWTKPSAVLISENNYSDAHLFPWVYHHLGIGKLIGMPVAGTGTAVWWETLQDPTLYAGIPEVGFRDAHGRYMENTVVQPDIEVPNDPALLAQGRDEQLEAAVRSLLGP